MDYMLVAVNMIEAIEDQILRVRWRQDEVEVDSCIDGLCSK